jgi:predicted transposase YdaD
MGLVICANVLNLLPRSSGIVLAFYKPLVRLWEQPSNSFMNNIGLLPFAVLSNTSNKYNTLQAVAAQIDCIADQKTRSDIAASAAILAGLVLEEEVIMSLLRRDIMRESVVYPSIKQEGKEETTREIAIRMLKKEVSVELVVEFTGLTPDAVQQLQTALSENQEE